VVEIGQVLRHRSVGSTTAYARVDVERLHTIALPWPTRATSCASRPNISMTTCGSVER
jgi:hypothetical protein